MAADDHTPSAIAIEDIVIPQGATESATWPTPWLYAEGNPLAPPSGWPGAWTARMQIRSYLGEGAELLATLHSTTTAEGTLNLDTTTIDTVVYARIEPHIPAATSAAWTWADTPDVVWDLEITNGTRIIRLVEGGLVLSGEATTIA